MDRKPALNWGDGVISQRCDREIASARTGDDAFRLCDCFSARNVAHSSAYDNAMVQSTFGYVDESRILSWRSSRISQLLPWAGTQRDIDEPFFHAVLATANSLSLVAHFLLYLRAHICFSHSKQARHITLHSTLRQGRCAPRVSSRPCREAYT